MFSKCRLKRQTDRILHLWELSDFLKYTQPFALWTLDNLTPICDKIKSFHNQMITNHTQNSSQDVKFSGC